MKKCRNPDCQEEIPDNLAYCNETCLRRHIEIKKQERVNFQDDAPNKGTEAKRLLQEQAMKCMKRYPKDNTPKEYACLLCWDIRVSQRTAFESYIQPMIAHGILVPSGKGRYRLSSEYE